ncbi:unnamed protein product [Boreogadus saida]
MPLNHTTMEATNSNLGAQPKTEVVEPEESDSAAAPPSKRKRKHSWYKFGMTPPQVSPEAGHPGAGGASRFEGESFCSLYAGKGVDLWLAERRDRKRRKQNRKQKQRKQWEERRAKGPASDLGEEHSSGRV